MEEERALFQIQIKHIFCKIVLRIGDRVETDELSWTLHHVWFFTEILQRSTRQDGRFRSIASERSSWQFNWAHKSQAIPTRWCPYILYSRSDRELNIGSLGSTWLRLPFVWIQIRPWTLNSTLKVFGDHRRLDQSRTTTQTCFSQIRKKLQNKRRRWSFLWAKNRC